MIEINIDNFSALKSSVSIDEEHRFILGEFHGTYKPGSKGNLDGLFMFSKIASVYFLYETISVIAYDFRKLNYSYGNTLLKALNFFDEVGRDDQERVKKIIVIVSKQNIEPIKALLRMINSNNHFIFTDFEKGMTFAEEQAIRYLTD